MRTRCRLYFDEEGQVLRASLALCGEAGGAELTMKIMTFETLAGDPVASMPIYRTSAFDSLCPEDLRRLFEFAMETA